MKSFLSQQMKLQNRRIAIAVLAMAISIFIGFRYGNQPYINLLPIFLWLWCILVCFAALHPVQRSAMFHFEFNRTWIGLFFLLTIAFFLRVVNLSRIPPAFHVDEAGSVEFSLLQIFTPALNGMTIHPLRTGMDSQPILYNYILRISIELFGFTITGARMSSIIAGTLSIAGVFLMVNETDGRKTAWLAAILMAAYHFHIQWSRIALSNIWATLLIPLTLGFFLRGLRKESDVGALLAGICLGLSAYFYTGGYVVTLLSIFVFWQAWKNTSDHFHLTAYTGKMLAMAVVVAAPLIVFALVYPEHFFDRANNIYGWKPAAIEARMGPSGSWWGYFTYQVTHSFGAYNLYSDISGFYEPRIPFLIGVSSVLFLIGIALSIWDKQYLPVIWVILVTILGGVMVSGTPGSSHFIAVIPAICWLVAIPIRRVSESKKPAWAYILLAAIVLVDLSFYFIIYPLMQAGDFTVAFPAVNP